MKNVSISISGTGQVRDELAQALQDVAAELQGTEGIYATVGVSDPPPAPPDRGEGEQAA